METAPTLSVVIATIGRPTLLATLESLRQLGAADELLLITDGRQPQAFAMLDSAGLACSSQRIVHQPRANDWGHTLRNLYSRRAKGERVLHIDDDDVYLDGALDLVRCECSRYPGRLVVFGMLLPGGQIPREHQIRIGNVQVHRRGNERTIGFYDERFSPAWCEDDDYARTMIERGRIYQRFHELDPLPGSIHSGTPKPQPWDRGRRTFAEKWPDDPQFGINQPSAPHFRTNRHMVKPPAAGGQQP